MTDSPAWRDPVDVKEQPILDALLVIRDDLTLLKSDKSKYVKSKDVMLYYDKTLQQTQKLNEIRVTKRTEQNRLDMVLDDCFQLISLFFLTIGRNNEAPAAYAFTSTVKRLLDHLREAGFYTSKDLHSIHNTLKRLRKSVEQGKDSHSPHILTLLEARIDACEAILTELQIPLSRIPADLVATNEKLVSILRTLSGLNTKSKFPVHEFEEYRAQLKEIQAQIGGDIEAVPDTYQGATKQYMDMIVQMSYEFNANVDGKELVLGLLARCNLWLEVCLRRQGNFEERFRDHFDTLINIRNALDKLSMTQAWSLRETDLYSYQRKLDRFDEARVNFSFVDAEGKPADLYEQRTLLYLLRKSYASIFAMLASSEPVSEALQPIYNQLTTLRKCLVEVKKSGGVSSPRELYPYSMKLNSIDNMREDGKFVVNGDIPEGQGSVNDLLAECYELAYELRNDAQASSDGERDENKDDDEDNAGRDPTVALAKVAKDANTSSGIGSSESGGVGISIGVN